jgi:hypothetical protein
MTDNNIIGIDGRQAVEVRKDHQERESREKLLKKKLKRVGLALEPENVPGRYRIVDTRPPQPHLEAWRDLSIDQVEDAATGIAKLKNEMVAAREAA